MLQHRSHDALGAVPKPVPKDHILYYSIYMNFPHRQLYSSRKQTAVIYLGLRKCGDIEVGDGQGTQASLFR
jgi:hypothetical protein